MDTVTLEYEYNLAAYTSAFNAPSVRGFDFPDETRQQGVASRLLSGDDVESIQGFQRVFVIDLGVVGDREQRIHLLYWMLAERKFVTYNGEAVQVCIEEPFYANDWLDGTEESRRYLLQLVEQKVRKSWPPSGIILSEGVNQNGQDYTMYVKRKVLIAGTLASPETFTTGSGKINVDQTGTAYPTFNGTTHVFGIMLVPYQDAHIVCTTEVTVSSGNLTFALARSDMGAAAGDGNYYCDIHILVQEK